MNESHNARYKPHWLLDVDGVLNAVCGSVPPDYRRERLNGYQITWSPEIVGRITALVESGAVELFWLTTWCHDAPKHIAPALGLPDAPVIGYDDWKAGRQPWWKTWAARAVSDAEPDRPLIWTDDDLAYAERLGEVDWLTERPTPYLALAPDSRTGLLARHLDLIERFVGPHDDGCLRRHLGDCAVSGLVGAP